MLQLMSGEKFTVKRAKEIARKANGRLPRPGWEALVWKNDQGTELLYLRNRAGKFELYHHISVNHKGL